MTRGPASLQEQYMAGLRAYLHHGGELALSAAYELGRVALAQGLGVLDMAEMHGACIEGLVRAREPAERERLLRTAAAYFNELLSPFEMSLRGYRTANQELERLNRTLVQQKQALEDINGELEAFSFSVSHDLRAPLRAIEGYTRLIREHCAARLDPDSDHMFGRILESTRHMAQLIEDLLALARVARGEIVVQDVDLGAIARGVVERLRAAAPGREVDVTIDADMHARGDARLLAVLLDNLLGNAWKFTARQPHARIAFRRDAHGGRAAFRVEDNGAGFDMAHAAKLFVPFSRLHSNREFEGTGIGLAIAERVVHRHGGTIWAEGRPGAGATFFFVLDSGEAT